MINSKYIIENDEQIEKEAGFSNYDVREKRLIDNVNQYSECSYPIIYFWLFLHLHYFYLGRKVRGIICLLTLNFFYIGTMIDILRISSGKMVDGLGYPVDIHERWKAEWKLNSFYITEKKRQEINREIERERARVLREEEEELRKLDEED